MPPEFLNRIDDVVMFNSLNKEDISKIIDIELQGLYNRIGSMGYKIDLTQEAKDFIIEKGYDPSFGARPLKRAIQKYLEDPMAEVIIKGNIKETNVIKVMFDKEKQELTFQLVKEMAHADKN